MSKRYEESFKKQVISLFYNGKTLADINREDGISKATVKTWAQRYNRSGSFDVNDNRSGEELELIKLRKK